MRPRLLVSLLSLGWFACSTSTDSLGTLRPNQKTLVDGRKWSDPTCGTGANFANCCSGFGAVCMDFTEYSVGDVRVLGNRAVVLIYANDGVQLALSDDLGASWRLITAGSIGGIFGFYPASLYLVGNRVIVMVSREVARPAGNVFLGQAYDIDLTSGASTALTGQEFLSSTLAATDPSGAWLSVAFAPDDLRGPMACTANLETWNPSQSTVTRTQTLFYPACATFIAPASDDGVTFQGLNEVPRGAACLASFDRVAGLGTTKCTAWSDWPAQSLPFVTASFSNERAQVLRPYAADGGAGVATPLWTAPLFLGSGVPAINRAVSGRPRFPGFIPLSLADGGSRLVRVNRDQTVDEVSLASSPCVGPGTSCFDPSNPDVLHADYGDALWAEPLGNDDFLMVYLHDLAPGINQVQLRITASREHATYRRIDAPVLVSEGPAGAPLATKGGLIADYCVKRRTCLGSNEDFYGCLGWVNSPSPALDAALQQAATASCDSPIFSALGYFDCLVRGGIPTVKTFGTTTSVECAVGTNLTTADCNTCQGDVAVSCSPPAAPVGKACAVTGQACQAGVCGAACTDSPIRCDGDLATFCNAGIRERVRCDLLGMACDATATGAWHPCRSKTTPTAYSTTNKPLSCQGRFLMWNVNGDQYADCTALGFTGCAGDRCTR